MATDFDAYRALGLERSAPPALVNAAYEQMRQRYRDDPQRLADVETAYLLLNDPEQRRTYDERHPPSPAEALEMSDRPAPTWRLPPNETITTPVASSDPVPWGLRELLIAMILPVLFVAGNIAAGFTTNVDEDELSTTDYIINFGFGGIVEGLLFFLAWFFSVRKYKVGWGALGFRKPQGVHWWFPIALLAVAFVLIWTYAAIMIALGIQGESNIPSGAFDSTLRIAMLAALSIAVAPLVEETFFRGFLFQGIAKHLGPWPGIAISAAIFGSVHLSTPDSFLTFIPIAMIGGVFAWGTWRSKSIVPGIIAHLLFNATSVTIGIITS